jgi:hypothetical protein
MERPNDETIAWYQAAIPDDPRVVRGQMFAHPCAFVNGHMFYGTLGQSVVVRLGADAVDALGDVGPARRFEPRPGRPWREYVQIAVGAVPAADLVKMTSAALEQTAQLPAKPGKAGPEMVKVKPKVKARAKATAAPAPAPKAKAPKAKARSGRQGAAPRRSR